MQPKLFCTPILGLETFEMYLLLPYLHSVFASLRLLLIFFHFFLCVEKFTCVAVFVISDDVFYTEAVLEELVVEKLALIPDHAKLVVSPSEFFESIAKVPETLHVRFPSGVALHLPFFTLMIETFIKRWQTLDLISMMQELQRTAYSHSKYVIPIAIKDSLSSLPAFQIKAEKHS